MGHNAGTRARRIFGRTTKKKKSKLRVRSPQANYTERPPLAGEVSANFCG
jgi:hypothetical protein